MFDKALEIVPLMAEAWLNKGVALLNPGEYRDALDHFNKALEIKPHYPQALSNKSLLNMANFFETSAKIGDHIQDAFEDMARLLVDSNRSKVLEST